jgi:tRNA threonylcarbamoyladenosine modification (KEOPS) complex Cgi121 subunit
MTKEQTLAIQRMNRALKALKDADIRIAGMDHNLIYATLDAIKNTENDRDYCGVANACQMSDDDTGTFKADCYQDSGGW